MTNPPVEDLFQLYESQYVSDLDGRLIRIEAATRNDLQRKVIVRIDGEDVKDVPVAVPATDDQGNIRREPRCVHHCPHEAAIRLEGIRLARRIGLAPAGPAGNEERKQEKP
jgi:hypothetical protein